MAANITNPSRKVTPVLEGRTKTPFTVQINKDDSDTVGTYTASGGTKKVYTIVVSAEGYARWVINYGSEDKITVYTSPETPSLDVPINASLLSGASVTITGYNNNTSSGLMDFYASVEHQI